jgi:hypothetical protein
MKKLTQILAICTTLIFLFSACGKKDPCEGVTCQNGGTCKDGTCQCPTGFEGQFCETASLPKAVNVSSIKVTKVPATKNDGSKWDNDGTEPDLVLTLVTVKADNTVESTIWTSDLVKLNAPVTQQHDFTTILPKLRMTDFTKTYALFLFDKDDATSENMGGISFNLKDMTKTKPATLTLDCATCKVAFELKVTYE